MSSESEDDWIRNEFHGHEMADPEIKKANEQTLGAFILAHNEVDYYLTRILDILTLRLRSDGSLSKFCRGTFAQRLNYLELLLATDVANLDINFDILYQINRKRNIVAHGHYDENPFDGSYTIIESKNARDGRPTNFSINALDDDTAHLRSISSTMQMYGDFQHYIWPASALRQLNAQATSGEGGFDYSQF